MKKYFFTGLVILLPIALTLMIIIFLFNFFTKPFEPLVANILNILPFALPTGLHTLIVRIFTLIILFLFVLALGVIARWFLIRNLFQATNHLLMRIPVIKSVFKLCRDVFTAIFSPDGKKAFDRPVMIPFPDHPNYVIGFLTGDVPGECLRKSNEDLASVFIPTAPHPISGFLFLVHKNDIYELKMDNEDAFKYLVSCGVIVPE